MSPKMPYDTRSACSMLGGRPTETRPATYFTSGEKCRIRLSRASVSRSPLNSRQRRSTGDGSSLAVSAAAAAVALWRASLADVLAADTLAGAILAAGVLAAGVFTAGALARVV